MAKVRSDSFDVWNTVAKNTLLHPFSFGTFLERCFARLRTKKYYSTRLAYIVEVVSEIYLVRRHLSIIENHHSVEMSDRQNLNVTFEAEQDFAVVLLHAQPTTQDMLNGFIKQ